MKCNVINCTNSNSKKNKYVGFYRFPKEEIACKQWVIFCRQNVDTETARVCGEHFLSEDFERKLQVEMGFGKAMRLKTGAIPTVGVKVISVESVARSKRILKRDNKKVVSNLLNETAVPEKKVRREEERFPLEEISSENLCVCTCSPSSEQILKDKIKLLESQIEEIKRENFCLCQTAVNREKDMRTLQMRAEKAEFEVRLVEEKLLTIFTPGQIKKLKGGGKRRNWCEEDISHSITLYSTSAKVYKLLRKRNFPLPAVRTLQHWAQKININTGVIEPVKQILSSTTLLDEKQKICVLSFDEMKVRKVYCYDKPSDTTYAPVDYVQVAMLRGLIAKWKQPIFYDFDCRMTSQILTQILEAVKTCGFYVAAVVSDMGATNRALFNALGVSAERPWFHYDGRMIYVFADVPHLIKLLRNHFLDHGFILNNKPVKKEVIVELLSCTSSELSITHKINSSHLTVFGSQRQKVKTATKLFSHTVAQAITRAASLGHLSGHNWQECHTLFKTTNDWFDAMNVRAPYADSRKRTHAYGLALDIQDRILDQMTEMVKTMRAIGKSSLLPFQKGIIQSNKALKLLYNDLKTKFGVEFLLTYRLNQDVLENFFGVIREKGGMNDHPDRQQFKYRLRSHILGRNEGVLSDSANVSVDDTPDLDIIPHTLTGSVLKGFPETVEDVEWGDWDDNVQLEGLENDGLENLAGYICHQLHKNVPNVRMEEGTAKSYTWVDHLSEGGLSKPSEELMGHMTALQKVFNDMNGEGLLVTKNFLQSHIANAAHIMCDTKIKKLFFRTRMFLKIRTLNKEIINNSLQKKKKLKKIVT